MKTLRKLDLEQLALAEYRLLHPQKGGRIEATRDHGVDMTLLVEHLRLAATLHGATRSKPLEDRRTFPMLRN